jgi:hypothetical protein
MDFVIVGGQRCGTTFVAHTLSKHAEINMLDIGPPEPKLFMSNEWERELKSISNIDKKVGLVGEKSTSYYESEQVPQRLFKHNRQLKVIFILREPIDRAISNYYFSLENDYEDRDISVALNPNNTTENEYGISVNPRDYLKRGRYIEFIRRYAEVFPKNQMGIFFYENIFTFEGINKLYHFLGVTPPKAIDFDHVVNGAKRSSRLENDKSVFGMLKSYYSHLNAELLDWIGEIPSEWLYESDK